MPIFKLPDPMVIASIVSKCDYCGSLVGFKKEPWSADSSFTHLVPTIEGSGSDYLATWCAHCGPKHRERN